MTYLDVKGYPGLDRKSVHFHEQQTTIPNKMLLLTRICRHFNIKIALFDMLYLDVEKLCGVFCISQGEGLFVDLKLWTK